MNEFYVNCNSNRGNMSEPLCRIKEGVINKIVILRPGDSFANEEDIRTFASWSDKLNAPIEQRLFVFPEHTTLEDDGGEVNVNAPDPGIPVRRTGDSTLTWNVTFTGLSPQHISAMESHDGVNADFIFFDVAGNMHVNKNEDGTVGGFNATFYTSISKVAIGSDASSIIGSISFGNARDFNNNRRLVTNVPSRIRKISGIVNATVDVISSNTSEIVVTVNRFDSGSRISTIESSDWDCRDSVGTVVTVTSGDVDPVTGRYTISGGFSTGTFSIGLKPTNVTTKGYETPLPTSFTTI